MGRQFTVQTQASRMTGRTVQELAGQLQLELEEAHYDYAALHQPGVQGVILTEPATDLIMD